VPWVWNGNRIRNRKRKNDFGALGCRIKGTTRTRPGCPVGEQEIETQHRLANQEGVQAETATKKKKQKDRPQTLPLIEGRRISRRKLRAAKSARETKQNGTRTTNKQDSCVGNKNPPLGDQIWTKRRTSRETEQRHRKIFWRCGMEGRAGSLGRQLGLVS
jgi:hypothetical protein